MLVGDGEIRKALKSRRLKPHLRDSDTLILDELGLAHSKSRIDVAMINGVLHGFEIKSEKDSLDRLPGQLEIYRQTLQKLTLVVASKHVKHVFEIVPDWCGVLEVTVGPRGGLHFEKARKAVRNPELDRFMFAHLLWRNEVADILSERGVKGAELRAPRKILYQKLVELVSEKELTELIKSAMFQRLDWRDHLRPQ